MKGFLTGVILAIFACLPTAMAAEFGAWESVETSGAHVELAIATEISTPDAETEAPTMASARRAETDLFYVDTFFLAWLKPAETMQAVQDAPASSTPEASPAALDVPSVNELVEAIEALAPAAAPVLTEAEQLSTEGVGTEARATATPRGAQASAGAQAGSVEISSGAQAQMPPIAAGPACTPSCGRSDNAREAEVTPPSAQPEPEPMPDPVLVASVVNAVPDASPRASPLAAAATVAVLATASSGMALFFAPGWRSALWKFLRRVAGLLLFSRIAQEDILNHGRRSELLEFVKQNPGERVEVARRVLGFSNGSMHYHLRVLSQRGIVRVIREQGYARLYLAGPKVVPEPYVPARRRKFLDALASRPGASQRDLAQALGLSERMVSYHIHALERQGLVHVQVDGARRRVFTRSPSES